MRRNGIAFGSVLFVLFICITLFLSGCSSSDSGGSASGESAELDVLIASPLSQKKAITITAGQSLNFQGTVSTGRAPFTYLWTFGGDLPSSSVEDPGFVTFSDEGTYVVTFRVKDAVDVQGEDSITLTVLSGETDSEPLASIDSPSGNPAITEGQSVNFQGSVQGGNGPFSYQWTFGAGSGISQKTVQDPGNITFSTPGTFTVTFKVTDADGDTSSATRNITVSGINEDSRPSATISSPSGSRTIFQGQTISFQGSVAGGNTPLTYLWTFGGGIPDAGVEDPGAITFNTTGTFTVVFRVSDADGDISSDSVTISVLPPGTDTNPLAAITSPAQDVTVYQGTAVTFTGVVSSGNAPFTYSWNFGAAGTSNSLNPGAIVFNTPGSWDVTFTVRDADGDSSTDSIRIVVLEQDDFSLINRLFSQFMEDPSDANYSTLMDAIDQLDDSPEASLYKACAEFFRMYESPAIATIMSDFSIIPPITLDSDFEQLQTQYTPEVLTLMTYDYLMEPGNLYLLNNQALLAETEARLDLVDSLLAEADGLDLTVVLDQYNQVQFDSVDIEVLRAMVNLGRALFIFLQAIDLDITDYMVEYDGSPVDVRYLVTHPEIHIDDDELEEAEMESVADQLFMNNSTLFTYSDRSRLASFRAALESARSHYSNAVTLIATMTQQERRDRYAHAFNLDTEYGVAWATLMRDEVLPSVMSCIDSPSGTLILPWDEETGESYVNGGDGFFYLTIYYNIYYDQYCFDSANYDISIYDILNSSASDSPRDIMAELRDLQQSLPPDEDLLYDPYVLCLQTVLYRAGVPETIWDEFF